MTTLHKHFGLFIVALSVVLVGCQTSSPVAGAPSVLPPNTNTATSGSTTTTSTAPTPSVPKPAVNSPTPVEPAPTPKPSPAPAQYNIPVAFISQAPYQVWDELHGEACEEASMLMVAKYLRGEPVTPSTSEQGILSLVKWEGEHGYKIDTTAAETVDILREYFSIKAELVTEVTVERMKQELAKGRLIIVPAAGRLLGNPNFTGNGPIYHMLVVRGYTATDFITNDPGTRKGDGYRYRHATLLNAIHDWDHGRAEGGMTDAEMAQGRKVMIVITDTK
jgi:hypothetical protein